MPPHRLFPSLLHYGQTPQLSLVYLPTWMCISSNRRLCSPKCITARGMGSLVRQSYTRKTTNHLRVQKKGRGQWDGRYFGGVLQVNEKEERPPGRYQV